MLIVTWNVNSLRARLPRVMEFLERHRPDVVCLQETKVAQDQLPHFDFQLAGYTVVDHSGGQWAGTALLVADGRELGDDITYGLPGEPRPEEARWVEATVDGIRIASVYVTNGRSPELEVFADKLRFLEAMVERARELASAGHTIIAGDINVAPNDDDVHAPDRFRGGTHVHPEERARVAALLDTGFVDAHQQANPGVQQFTWWDYRAGAFHKNLGMRIDLAFVSNDLAARIDTVAIDRDFRKGDKPSDHAPLLLQLREA